MPTSPEATPSRVSWMALASVPVARRGGEPVAQVAPAEVDRDRIPQADELLGVLAVPGADVDPDVVELGDLLALVGGQQVRRLAGDDAGDGAVLRPDDEVLSQKDL